MSPCFSIKFANEIEDCEMLGVYLGVTSAVLKDIKSKNQHHHH